MILQMVAAPEGVRPHVCDIISVPLGDRGLDLLAEALAFAAGAAAGGVDTATFEHDERTALARVARHLRGFDQNGAVTTTLSAQHAAVSRVRAWQRLRSRAARQARVTPSPAEVVATATDGDETVQVTAQHLELLADAAETCLGRIGAGQPVRLDGQLTIDDANGGGEP